MSQRKDPISIVKQLADLAELEKSQQVAASIVSLSAEEERLAVLERYVAEYRIGVGGKGRLAIDTLKARYDFIAALDRAIRAQGEQVLRLRAQFEQKLDLWRDAKAKASAVERFAERREDRRERALAHAEQAALDETGRWSQTTARHGRPDWAPRAGSPQSSVPAGPSPSAVPDPSSAASRPRNSER